MDIEQRPVRRPVLTGDHLLDDDGERVRQLVAHPFQGSLADELGDHHLLGFVGQLTVGVQRRAGRQPTDQHVREQPHLERRHRTDRHHVDEVRQRADREQLRAERVPIGHQVTLGDDRDQRCPLGQPGELSGDEPVARAHRLVRGDAEGDHVHL